MNTVELIGHYGGDLEHCLSAWTSTSRDLTEDKKMRMGKLLSFLAREGHHTPFEKSTLHFLVRCDTATHIQFLKHRIGVSVNAESARYRELENSFQIPRDWPEDEKEQLQAFCKEAELYYHAALERLEKKLGRDRAKESARFYLPYANQLNLDISFNWRSFSYFLNLRNRQNAQKEIRDIAQEMLHQVMHIPNEPFALTIHAFRQAKLLGDG